MNHVGDLRNIDVCVIDECLNKVVQFSPKKRQSIVNKYCLNELIENPLIVVHFATLFQS